MNQEKKHTRKGTAINQEVIQRMKNPFTKSADQAWEAITERITEKEGKSTLPADRNPVRKLRVSVPWLAAASLAMVLGIITFLRFYSVEVVTSGESASLVLPAGSEVELEPASSLKYNSLWWRVKRLSKLEGTAAFDVEKGKPFIVRSATGITEVLGTRFQITTGESDYSVTCFSGSVKVSDPSGKVAATLQPNEKATIEADGSFNIQYINIKPFEEKESQNKYISFKGASVYEVFTVLGEHFRVRIEVQEGLEQVYTGNFTRGNTLEEILPAVCSPLGLTYEKVSQNRFIVYREP